MGYEYELLDVLSRDQLRALQRHYFNQPRFYIPVDLPADHALVRVLGLTPAKKLSDALGGSLFAVTRSLLIRQRNEAIKAERAMGVPPGVVASRYGVAERTVRRVCQGETLVANYLPFGLRRRQLQADLQGWKKRNDGNTPEHRANARALGSG